MLHRTSLVAACALAVIATASGGELERLHAEHARDRQADPQQSRTMDEITSTEHGITEIAIERTPCFGKCPVYTAVIRSDGTIRYHGEANVSRAGKHAGRIPREKFHDLARYIDDAGYMRLEPSYELAVTDMPTVYTSVAKGDRRKVIRNYANAGPTKLWAVEQLIDKLLQEAEWDRPRQGPGSRLE